MKYHDIKLTQCRVHTLPDFGWFAHFLQQSSYIFDKNKKCFGEIFDLGFKGKEFFSLEEERNNVIERLFRIHKIRNPSSHGGKSGLPTITIDNLNFLYQFSRRYMDMIFKYFK
jgi:hypothetical protein